MKLLVLTLLVLFACTDARDPHVTSAYVHKSRRKESLIYPDYDQCSDADDLKLQFDFFSGSVNWSHILNAFYFHTFNESSSFGEELVAATFPSLTLFTGILYWTLVHAVGVALSLVITPILGGICFVTCAAIAYYFMKGFKKVGRFVIIKFEKVRRARERIVIPKRYRNFRRRFRMPVAFRNYSDEEVPDELKYEESSDSGSSNVDEDDDNFLAELERKARLGKYSWSLSTLGRSRVGMTDSRYQQAPERATTGTEAKYDRDIEAGKKLKVDAMTGTDPLKQDRTTSTDHEDSSLSDDEYTTSSHFARIGSVGLSVGTQTTLESSFGVISHDHAEKTKKLPHGRPKTAAFGRLRRKKAHELGPGLHDTISRVSLMQKMKEGGTAESTTKTNEEGEHEVRNTSPQPKKAASRSKKLVFRKFSALVDHWRPEREKEKLKAQAMEDAAKAGGGTTKPQEPESADKPRLSAGSTTEDSKHEESPPPVGGGKAQSHDDHRVGQSSFDSSKSGPSGAQPRSNDDQRVGQSSFDSSKSGPPGGEHGKVKRKSIESDHDPAEDAAHVRAGKGGKLAAGSADSNRKHDELPSQAGRVGAQPQSHVDQRVKQSSFDSSNSGPHGQHGKVRRVSGDSNNSHADNAHARVGKGKGAGQGALQQQKPRKNSKDSK